MRTTIDRRGRVVIPRRIRDEFGLRGGDEVEVTVRDGRIEVESVSKAVRLVERDGFLAAEIAGEIDPRLTTEDVRALMGRQRR